MQHPLKESAYAFHMILLSLTVVSEHTNVFLRSCFNSLARFLDMPDKLNAPSKGSLSFSKGAAYKRPFAMISKNLRTSSAVDNFRYLYNISGSGLSLSFSIDNDIKATRRGRLSCGLREFTLSNYYFDGLLLVADYIYATLGESDPAVSASIDLAPHDVIDFNRRGGTVYLNAACRPDG